MEDIYRELPPILTAKDIAEFLKIGVNQSYQIIAEIGFRYGRTVRCTKNQLIHFIEVDTKIKEENLDEDG